MKSGIAAVKAQHQQVQLIKIREGIINKFASNPSVKCRAVTKVTKSILLNGPYLLNGIYYDVKAKSLGAGVYELSLELVNK